MQVFPRTCIVIGVASIFEYSYENAKIRPPIICVSGMTGA
jgi:hypothetical protein